MWPRRAASPAGRAARGWGRARDPRPFTRLMSVAPVVPSMSDRAPAGLARAYYRAVDAGDYEALAGLLAPDFRQVRGDRTLDGRDAFVRFMREERPETDTTHEVDAVYATVGGAGADGPEEVAARGRLRRGDGSTWFGFVDVFRLDGDRFDRLVTYTNERLE